MLADALERGRLAGAALGRPTFDNLANVARHVFRIILWVLDEERIPQSDLIVE